MIVSVRLLVGTAIVAATAVAAGATAVLAVGDKSGDTMTLNTRYTKAAGTTFAWASIGVGRPLVLLNGTGSPMSEWDPALLESLAKGRRVIVFDYPGIGLSGPAPARWTFNNAANWVADFIATAIPDQAVDVLGWSMGGFIAQRLAVTHKGTVRRLVLASTNPGGPAAVLGPDWVQEADSDPNAGDLTYLRTNYPWTPQAQTAGNAFLQRLTRAQTSKRYPVEEVPPATYKAMVKAEDAWLTSSRNVKQLTGLSVPTLVMTGQDDVVTPPENTKLIAALIPGAKMMLYPGAGHSFLFQHPKRVGHDVIDFLNTP